jgi:metal-responsive CopG/Arc/MetJ family transcriptional regulator
VARDPKRKPLPKRPLKGRDPFIAVRIPHALLDRIDGWAEQNTVSRSEAVRRLAEKALNCQQETA